jgi:outer membrane protein assembly factor BamE (lipoprotein component of BamABCDE complex)
MAGRVSRIGRLAAVLLVVPLAQGCTSIVNHRGYLADELLLRSVAPGIDNRQSVEKTLGKPSFASQFGPQVWYYVASNTKQAPFTRPRIYQHAVFAVHFDQGGNVAKIDRSGLELVARIDPENDKTPTLGRERGFLEDLFGNIGAVSTAGGGAGGGGGGGGGG